MLKKNFLVAALLLSGLTISAGAFAQNYIGASAGHAQWNINCAGASACSKGSTALKVFGGVDLSPTWAVEGGIFSMGKATAIYGSIKGEFEARGIEIAGVVKTPAIKGFVGFGKLGMTAIKGETTASIASSSGMNTKNTNQAVYGFGLMYQLNNDIRLRAEIEKRDVKVGDFDGAKGSIANFSIGLQASF